MSNEFVPQTDDETYAAAIAVRDARRWADAAAQADQLTERERLLIETAYRHGSNAAQARVSKAIGAAAATVDANAIRDANTGRTISARSMPPFGYDRALLEIVRYVHGHLNQNEASVF